MARIGTGDAGDAFRVDMPTYRLVAEIFNGSVWVVECPDVDCPDLSDLGDPVQVAPGLRARMLNGLGPLARIRWWRRIDERYRQHSGRWRPGTEA